MKQQSSQSISNGNHTGRQQIKRWSTASSIRILAGILLIALYSLLSPKMFMTPVAAQTSGNLIENGDFDDGLNGDWSVQGTVELLDTIGSPAPSVRLGSYGASITQNEIFITGNVPGIYELSFDCTNGNINYAEITAQIISSDPQEGVILEEDWEGEPYFGCSNSETVWDTRSKRVLLLPSNSYTLILERSSPDVVLVDNVSLTRVMDVDDLDTGLIENGEFIGHANWALSEGELPEQGADYNGSIGVIESQLGAIKFLSYGATITQNNITVEGSEPGIYELSFDCTNGDINYAEITAQIISSDPQEGVILEEDWGNPGCSASATVWDTLSKRVLLLPSNSYTLILERSSPDVVLVDNVSLTRVMDVDDLDTGLIENGEFIGASGWSYSGGMDYWGTPGPIESQLGAPEFIANLGTITQTNIEFSGSASTAHVLSFQCARSDVNALTLSVQLASSDPEEGVVLAATAPCGVNPWFFYSWELQLSPAPTYYTLTFQRPDGAQIGNGFVDNVTLKVPEAPLLDSMIWNAYGECPFCTAQDAVGWAGGPINTDNGNLSYQETDLSIPVAGGNLEFRRSYASQTVNVYNTEMGHGWVHNYNMRLVFTGTTLPNTVEFQAPGGSRLPFFINGDGTYTPYPGVTAQLSHDDPNNRYIITSFDQYTYYFAEDSGRLQQQKDDIGNVIDFDYVNGKLDKARQGTRFLEYAYYPGTGYLHTVTDHTGRVVELGYVDGDLRAVTNPLDKVTNYDYLDTTHLLTLVTDPSGKVVERTAYDAGRAYQQRDGVNNLLVNIDYSQPGQHTVTENGVVTTHTYDNRNTLISTAFTCTDGTPGCGTSNDVGYDPNFQQDEVVDNNNNPTTLRWNDNGSNLEYVRDALNNETHLDYNGYNNLTQLEDALRHETIYKYENSNFPTFLTSMTKVTEGVEIVTEFVPTTAADGIPGLLKSVEDPNGHLTTYRYNDYGQVIEQIIAEGTPSALTTNYQYDTLGRLIVTTQTSATESHKLLNVYNDGNQLIATIANWTGSDPATWQSQCIIPAPDSDENICTRYAYDEAGRPTSTTNALGHINLAFYDPAGRTELTVTNWDGTPYTNPLIDLCDFVSPDPEFNLCSRTEYDENGRVFKTTDGLGHQTVAEYDSLGRVKRTIVNWIDGVFNPLEPDKDLITQYEYDAVGNVLVVTDPLGHKTRTFYDQLNRVKGTIENWDGSATLTTCATLPRERDTNICTRYQYDKVGNTTHTTNTLNQTTRTFYDELNRVEFTVENWQIGFNNPSSNCIFSANNTNDENICTLYGYDNAGNQISTKNTLNQTTRTFYDELNRVEFTIENWQIGFDNPSNNCVFSANNTNDENICTLYGYDDVGNQITTKNALNQRTLTVYDGADRPFLTVANWNGVIIDDATDCQFPPGVPDVNVCTLTTYDALGRRIASKDALGNITEFDYDALGRLDTITRYLDGLPITDHTEYDALSNRLSSTDAEGNTTTYEYDSLNRLVKTTSAEGVVSSQTYNAVGWVLTSSDGLEHSTTIEYDLMGRQTHVIDPEDNITAYQYDALGNQTAVTDAEGVKTTYVYDGLNRLKDVIENDVLGNNPTHETDVLTQYIYDALGNRTAVINANHIESTQTTYDDLNRPILVLDALENETHTAYNALGLRTVMTDGNLAVTTYVYDGLNRLSTTNYQADGEIVTYTYNGVGNRLTMQDNLGTTTYQYDDLYRLRTVTDPFTAEVGYDYDDVGNRTQLIYPADDRTVTYTYDDDNRLIQVEDGDEDLATYSYDPTGRLTTTELPNGIVTFYTYDDANRLILLQHVDTNSGETIARYEYELDDVGNRIAVTETMRLPQTGGQAALPSGVVHGEDAPLTAEEVIATIQPADVKDHLSRLSQPGSPVLQEEPPLPPQTPPIDAGQTFTTTEPLPLVEEETLPFDPAAVIEQARNQVETEADGTAFIERPTHEATFETTGELNFAPVITTTDLLTVTLDPATPLSITVELTGLAVGRRDLTINPIPGEQEVSENVVSLPRGSQLVEEFIARDGGIEQRWQLLTPPPGQGNLVLEVEATTALSLTIDGDGFVFHAPTADGQTLPIARYGRALAIDATGAEQWADLAFSELDPAPDGSHHYRLEMTLSADWLATAQYPLLIDPLLSNLVRLEQIAPANNQSAPEVAYNPDLDEFLLVWQDYRNGNWDIYAQRVNGDGALLDENFIITNAANQQSNPQIAYGDGVYLVAWRHFPPATYYDVRGAIIAGNGQILLNNLAIATNNSRYEYPTDVIFNSTSNKFLVVWHEKGTYWNVSGRHVAPDGTMGSTVLITPQANPQEDTSAGAYNPESDEYLIVWQRYTGSGTRSVMAQRLAGNGTSIGSAIDLGNGSGDEQNADVIYLAASERYVVVWRDSRNNGASSYDIYGQQVNPDGTFAGSNFVVTEEIVEESMPRLALDPSTGGALVIWQKNNGGTTGYDLYGRLLDSNGLLAGDSFVVEAVNANQNRPVLAANTDGDFLVAWYDERNGNQDIFTSMKLANGGWGGAGMAHPAPGAQEKPQIAYNPDDDEYLVVWQDYRSSSNWDLYGQRVDGDGSLLGPNIAIDTTATKHQTNPQVAYGANEYLVAWQHYTDNNNTTYDVYGRVVNRNGTFATSAFVIANALDSGTKPMKESPTDIAYNSSSNQFLVVWKAEYSVNNWNISGRHVSPSGTTGSYIQITAVSGHVEKDAAVTYNPEDNQYLVVWEQHPIIGIESNFVYGRRLTGSGSVITSDNIEISGGLAFSALADVVYRADTDRYLVVWQQLGDIYSRGVLPNGSLAGGATVIANASQYETSPRLASDSQGLLAIWQRQNTGSSYDLYARPLDANGQPTGNPFTIQETMGNQQNPAIAYSSGNRYQLAWQDDSTGPWDLFTATLDRSYQVTNIQYDYDPLYRLTSAVYSGDLSASYSYAYNAVGNMTAYTEQVNGQTTTVNRTFNDANQLDTSTDTQLGTTSFYYDYNGNLVDILPPGVVGQGPGAIRYDFNQRNLLLTQENYLQGTGWTLQAEFVYDGDDNRLQQIDHTDATPITTSYTNDIVGLSQALVSSDGTTTTYNLFGLDLISQDDGTQTLYLLGDGLGSTRLELVNSTIETATTYEPYGKVLAQTGATGTTYGFTGEQEDAATGLLYLRARYYNPSLKQFQSRDPFPGYAILPASQNGYSYVGGNPVNIIDPLGQCYPPFEWLRDVETTNCANLDAAIQIAKHPGATGWQKAGAYTYIGFWGGSHVALVVGLTTLGGSTVPAIIEWGASFLIAHPTMTTVATTGAYIAGFADDAAVIYGAATGDPQAQQAAMVAQQIAQSDGHMPFADTVAGAYFFGPRIGKRLSGFADQCGINLLDHISGATNTFETFVGYHGTSSVYVDSIRKGINPPSGANFGGGSQLGDGFYTTPDMEAASYFARVATGNSGGQPVILEIYAQDFHEMSGVVVNDPSMWWRGRTPREFLDDRDMVVAPISSLEPWWQVKFNPHTYNKLKAK